ncbi:fumarylacetoacetate hydrolase family protein [Nocardia sp. NPDC052278]|uniref:fumarylacetoacetate hydrolase family protein n=1 Tax=unclassified Nocardia TaxID=2637762 RepID=UPI0036AB9656
MRLYTTDDGLAREDRSGVLAVLDLPYAEVGELLRGPGIDAARTAQVLREQAIDKAVLRSPVSRPGKVLIVGLNYGSHAAEALEMFAAMGKPGITLPSEPNLQVAAGSAVTGPADPIVLPGVAAEQVDYEGEVAVVMGTAASGVAADKAWRHVAGLTVVNDVSARDIQRRAMTGDPTASIGVAKSFDTFKPLGPCVVTADEFTETPDLAIRTRVNGILRQDDRTSGFIHSIPELISHLSRYQTLEPGDVICTGTPRGAGVFSESYLRAGDLIEVDVEGIGVLGNRVVRG